MGKAILQTRPIKILLFIARVFVDYVRYSFFTFALLPTVGTLLFLFLKDPTGASVSPVLQLLSFLWPSGDINEKDILQLASSVSLGLYLISSLLSFIVRKVLHRTLPAIPPLHGFLYTIAPMIGLYLGAAIVTLLSPGFGWGYVVVIVVFGFVSLFSTVAFFLLNFLSRKISLVLQKLPEEHLVIEHPMIRG